MHFLGDMLQRTFRVHSSNLARTRRACSTDTGSHRRAMEKSPYLSEPSISPRRVADTLAAPDLVFACWHNGDLWVCERCFDGRPSCLAFPVLDKRSIGMRLPFRSERAVWQKPKHSVSERALLCAPSACAMGSSFQHGSVAPAHGVRLSDDASGLSNLATSPKLGSILRHGA